VIAQRLDKLFLAHLRAPADADLPGLVIQIFLAPILVLRGLAATSGGCLAAGIGNAGGLFLVPLPRSASYCLSSLILVPWFFVAMIRSPLFVNSRRAAFVPISG
jgi:hypothetical protein